MVKLWKFASNAESFELKDIEAALSEIQVIIWLHNFARDESSNHDSENCSEISAVTPFGIYVDICNFQLSCFSLCPIAHEMHLY